ncbi:MAG: hypothetical protein AAFO28_04850, partial [Pseudomonadota bacterium]
VRVLVDTGLNFPLLVGQSVFDDFFAEKEAFTPEPMNTAGGKVIEARGAKGVRLGIAGVVEVTVDAASYPDSASGRSILLGNPIFGFNPVVFEAGRDAIFLLPAVD